MSLAVFEMMHKEGNLKKMLSMLCNDLCSGGIIEKGLIGELCTWLLLIVAWDLAVLGKGWGWEQALRPV